MTVSLGRRSGLMCGPRGGDAKLERALIAKAIAEGRPLANWPPSRGPKPAWVDERVEVVAVPPKLVIVPFKKRHKSGDPMGAPSRPLIPRVPLPYRELAFAARYRHYPRRLDFDLDVSVTEARSVGPELDGVMCAALDRSRRPGPHDWTGPVVRDLPPRALTFDLTYPLDVIARVTIFPLRETASGVALDRDGAPGKPYALTRRRMSVGYLCHSLAKVYEAIYAEHKTYGVWGHAIEDLVFERFEIRDNIGKVFLAS